MNYELFMRQALAQAELALASGEFPVGCVLVYQDEILTTGTRQGTTDEGHNEIDHAEIVALRRLADIGDPVDRSRITAFSTMEPCLMCYAALIIAGIGQLVYAYEDVMGGGTGCELTRLNPIYRNSRLKVVPNILRAESLTMFKNFFANPANGYLRHSLLAEYTLWQ